VAGRASGRSPGAPSDACPTAGAWTSSSRAKAVSDVLERGAIAFLYRPRVETFVARELDDVQRFFVLLAPRGGRRVRRVRVGRKRLPDPGRRERFWAYVDRVAASVAELVSDLGPDSYWTKTRGLRHQPGPRIAGEGAYALARHRDHVHLAYALVAPRHGEVEDELRIAPRASYIVATFAESVEPGAGERRFVPLEPAHLDVPGAELVLIAAGAAVDPDVASVLDRQARAEAALFGELPSGLGRPRLD